MDPFAHQVPERRIDHPLPLDTVLAAECGALDVQAEMALARGIMTRMASVELTLVDQLHVDRRKRRVEPREHFSRNRSDGLGFHQAYIEDFNGDEAIQDARAGRRGEGEVRRRRLYGARRVQGAAGER